MACRYVNDSTLNKCENVYVTPGTANSQKEERSPYVVLNSPVDGKGKHNNSTLCRRIMVAVAFVIVVLFVAAGAWKLWDLEKTMEEYENRVHNLLPSNESALMDDIRDLKRELDSIKTNVNRQDVNNIQNLKRELDSIKTSVNRLDVNDIQGLKAQLDSMKTDVNRLDINDIQGLKGQLDSIKTNVNSINRKVSGPFSIAFYATISTPEPFIRNGDTVEFDSVKLNRGNQYNSGNGIFTVRSKGLYFFSMHFTTANGRQVNLQMYRNGDKLCGVYPDIDGSKYDNGVGSCSSTVELDTGDRVYVKQGFEGSSDKSLDCHNNWCGFTGFLMKPN